MHLLRLFMVKPVGGVKVALQWRGELLQATMEKDGFFKFDWKSETEVDPGWHLVTIHIVDDAGRLFSPGEGKIFVPHVTQNAFISDIDDTVLISHSATALSRLTDISPKKLI